MQTALNWLFPPQCLTCDALTATDFDLCSECWKDTPFIDGLACDLCGAVLPGDDAGHIEHCDDCIETTRPWQRGRAAMQYKGNARRMILALKHGDRPDLAKGAAKFLVKGAADLVTEDTIVIPVPIHWRRRASRLYNQSAELAQPLAKTLGVQYAPLALLRRKPTQQHKGLSVERRFENMAQAIVPCPKREEQIFGKDVLLVDDVMTSGATFHSATLACKAAGAASVNVLSLARATRDA